MEIREDSWLCSKGKGVWVVELVLIPTWKLTRASYLGVAQIDVPKWHLGKWSQRLKPA